MKPVLYFTNARILYKDKWEIGTIIVQDGKIINIVPEIYRKSDVIDLRMNYCVPGFIDIHTHGGNGYDINFSSKKELLELARFYAKHGVTAWNASILTDSMEQTLTCISNVISASRQNTNGAEMLGIHLEGPFLAKEYKGAMPEQYLRSANINLFRTYYEAADGMIRYITVSPEVDGTIELTREINKYVPVAVGHTGADYLTTRECIEAGAEAATHTANAMRLLHQHEPGAFGAIMEAENIFCEIICDGKHLHPAVVRLLLKWKGLEKIILISDSIQATGLPDGNYKLGINDVVVKDGDATLFNGVRAGSTLTMDDGLRKFMQFTGLPLEKAVKAVSDNPSRLLRIADRKGSIQIGKDADFTILNDDLYVQATYVRGRCIYKS